MKPILLLTALLLVALGTARAEVAPRRIDIKVTEHGFTPNHIKVARGKRVRLVFERQVERTCAKEVVIDTGAEKIERELPLNQPVEILVTFPKAGELTYACGMNMYTSTISVK
jgi:plastocyanin domain-containing protein